MSEITNEQIPNSEVKPCTINIPRRIRLDLMTEGEKAIYNAAQEVEMMGADVRLTDAIIFLEQARNSVADFVDGINRRYSVNDKLNEIKIIIEDNHPEYAKISLIENVLNTPIE